MTDANTLSDALASAVEAVGPSVVRVEQRCGGATGVVWSADGLVLAAHHAVTRDDDVTLGLGDGRSVKAAVVGRDPRADLVVLRAAATDLIPAPWADGEDLKVGHVVMPLGRPGRTVRAAFGIVGAIGEAFRTPGGAQVDRYLEVDGSLPRGFSGGPLVDARGRALGMNTAGVLRGGATIPTPTLRRIAADLVANGRIGRGWIGVSVMPVRLPEGATGASGQRRALVVVGIEKDSPAARDGLIVGDVLVTLDGQALEGPGDLMALLEGRVQAAITLGVLRAGEARDLKVTTAPRA